MTQGGVSRTGVLGMFRASGVGQAGLWGVGEWGKSGQGAVGALSSRVAIFAASGWRALVSVQGGFGRARFRLGSVAVVGDVTARCLCLAVLALTRLHKH